MTKALTIRESYPLIADPESFTAVVALNLEGETLTPFELDRLRVPAGGSLAWDVDGSPEKTIEGIILHQRIIRSYWAESFDHSGGGSPPDCSSPDGRIGIGEPGGDCAACPMAQFGSQGYAQACKQIRVLFLARPGEMLPTVIMVPPSSLQATKKYLLSLASKGRPYTAVVTSLALEKAQSKSGITYSRIVPSMARALEPDEAGAVRNLTESLRDVFGAPLSVSYEDVIEADAE